MHAESNATSLTYPQNKAEPARPKTGLQTDAFISTGVHVLCMLVELTDKWRLTALLQLYIIAVKIFSAITFS